jgi:hypothetical protein
MKNREADWGSWGWSTFDILDDPGDGCVLVGLLANMAAMEKFILNSRADV